MGDYVRISRRALLKGASLGLGGSLITRVASADSPSAESEPEVVVGLLASVQDESNSVLIETEEGSEEILFSQDAFFWRDRDVSLSEFRTDDQVAVEMSSSSESREGVAMMAVLQTLEGSVEQRNGRQLQVGDQQVVLTRDSDVEWDQREDGRSLDDVAVGQQVLVRGREVGAVLFAFRIRIVSQ